MILIGAGLSPDVAVVKLVRLTSILCIFERLLILDVVTVKKWRC